MDVADLAWLRSSEGSAAAAEAQRLLAGGTELSALRLLGRSYSGSRARAAVALALGRDAAATKFTDAGRLFCDREAVQQASHEVVARHLAARFTAARRVADLGCGMGGDTLAIAHHAEVVGIDRDAGRLAMLDANAAARGLSARVTCVEADLQTWAPPPGVDAIWADPARRDDRGRQLRPEAWSPPLARILELTSQVGAAGVKLAPGIDTSVLPEDGEVEFVSLGRDMKAAVLWLGGFARARRTATVLPAGASLTSMRGDAAAPLGDPGAYLYDPDPAIGRAGLVDVLAAELGAWKLDERIAYLSADTAAASPFARCLRVLCWFPFAERTVTGALCQYGAGRVEVARRGSPVDPNALERRLNKALRSSRPSGRTLVVVLTRLRGEHVALVCERDDGAP